MGLILSLSAACSSTDGDEKKAESASPEIAASPGEAGPTSEIKAAPEAPVTPAAADTAIAAKGEGSAANAEVEAPLSAPAATTEKKVYPTASLVNLRQGPGKGHPVARKAKFGEAITLSGEVKGSWLKTSDGLWVSQLFTSETKPDHAQDPVVEAAPVASQDASPAPAQKEEAPAAVAPSSDTAPAAEAAPTPATETAAPSAP